MGCGASKVVDKALVKKCRERKRLIKNAVDYRYMLSNSHVAYFHSLKDIGYALSIFVDEQLLVKPPSPDSDDDADAALKSMPLSGSDTILSSDNHGHDYNGDTRIHDDDADAKRTTVIQPEETRGSVDDAYVDESIGTSTKIIRLGHEQNSSWTSTSRRKPTGNESLNIDDEGYSTTQNIELSALREVFKEIKDEFEAAFSYGEQVALMLEAGKLPYQSRFHVLKGKLSKILGPLTSSTTSSSTSRVTKLAGSYNVYDFPENWSLNLSSTLEKLYMWEKKLYKEVKDAERLRMKYQRMLKRLPELEPCRANSNKIHNAQASEERLTELEPCRANSSKIHAAQAYKERLRTKLDISMKLIDAISSEIHQVRDMELQPQVSKLIYGLIGMWQSIGKCHRKQLEAIKESRRLTLRANTSMDRDSSLRTTLELEARLVTWAQHFNSWINAQKSFVDSLNGWLLQFIDHEPEINTDGGEVPYSPGRSGAPPIFIICNDWQRQLKGVSQERVYIAMNKFALKLRQLLEIEDEIQRLSKSQVDLDHKKAMLFSKNVGAGSLQGGVIPIFRALENFSHDVFKAHKHVRLQ